MSDLVFIRAFANRFEAELAQQHLADHGIDALVQADDAGGMYAGLNFSRKGVRIFVRPEDTEAAIEVLDSEVGSCDDADLEAGDEINDGINGELDDGLDDDLD